MKNTIVMAMVLLVLVSIAAAQATISQLNTDKSTYFQGENVASMATVANNGNASIYNTTLSFAYFSPLGAMICYGEYYGLVLLPGTRTFDSTCQLGQGASLGYYYLNTTLYGPGKILDSRGAVFQVAQKEVVSGDVLNVFTNKASYRRKETVQTTAVIKNTGNVIYGGYVRFTYEMGGYAYKTEDKYFSSLGPGSVINATSAWLIPSNARRGTYSVSAGLYANSTALDSGTASFSVR